MGMGDTCYPNFVPLMMDEFERHLYLYYFNGLKPPPSIQMDFKSISDDPVKDNNFLHKRFFHNYVRRHKEFKC